MNPGSERPPSEKFSVGSGLFLRLLAVVHIVAFASFWNQAAGLVGPHGILPASRLFAYLHQHSGSAAYWELPSLCWWWGTGVALPVLCAVGIALAALLFAGVAPAFCLILLWLDYLSLVAAGQIFFDYQWDALLLETTLLAVFLAPWSLWAGWRRVEPPGLARGLLVWLLFRLMLLSGLVKLTSGDFTWRHLTALLVHFQTQPLPTPLAWYAHQLPPWLLRAACAAMFAIELLAPFALAAPRRWRHPAILALIGLQLAIAATGNYTFFNWLTIGLCLLCLDDSFWGAKAAADTQQVAADLRAADAAPNGPPPGGRQPPGFLLRFFAGWVIFLTATEAVMDFVPAVAEWPPLVALVTAVAPFRSLNNYGLFAQMTTIRPELIIQGSDDGRDWSAYELPHKPGSLARAPDFIAPLQPRLDWQLWFAALEPPEENRWVMILCAHLLRGTPEVLGLFSHNPFPGHPPRFIRVVRYKYRFTTRAERSATGDWWHRDLIPLDIYVPAFSL